MASKPVGSGLGSQLGGTDRGGGRRRKVHRRRPRVPEGPGLPREREPVENFDRASPAILNKPPKILQKHQPEKPRVAADYASPELFQRKPHADTPFKIKTRANDEPKVPDHRHSPAENVVPPRSSNFGTITIASSKMGTPLRINVKEEVKKTPTPSHSPRPVAIEVPVHKRLSVPAEMTQSVKLVDESGSWCENGLEMLLDLNDYLVVGALGMQGSGKSTVMSFLAGNDCGDERSSLIFKPESKDTILKASHETYGIDLFVTKERILLLDTQPVLSSSVLDDLLSHEKNLPPEYTSAENYADMQSLQLAAFLMTVCHVVLVVIDWLPDLSLMEFLKRAEMLKPPTPSPPTSQAQDVESSRDKEDYSPNIAFVLNKASPSDFHPSVVKEVEKSITSVFKNSKLKFQGCSSLARANIMPSLTPASLPLDVNLFLIPHFHEKEMDITTIYNNGQSILYSLLPQKVKCHPRTETLVRSFRNQIYGASRSPLTHTSLTEKNWFHYAARTWETMRKSSLMSDFNRLLT